MVRITTLIDNHALPESNLEAEHGFSCFIEIGHIRVLFDTGCGAAFIRNADKLGVDLSDLDHLVISHGHYDHGGGVVPLLETYSYSALPLWTGSGFEKKKYAKDPGGLRPNGLKINNELVNKHQLMWRTVCTDTVMIHPGIWLVSEFAPIHPIEQPNPRFLIEEGEGKQIDTFIDEVIMVIDAPPGLIVIVGCSHPGILNIIDTVAVRFSRPIHALFGGIHLFDVSNERREIVVQELIERSIPLLGVSHCTGDKASKMLQECCSGYFANYAGKVTSIS